MARKIKERVVQKNVKTLEKSVSTINRMQHRTREMVRTPKEDKEENEVSYAENRITTGGKKVSEKAIGQLQQQSRNGIEGIRTREERKSQISVLSAGKNDKSRDTVPTENRNGSIKQYRRTIKTSSYKEKKVVKATEHTVPASQRAKTKTMKDAKKSVQRAKATEREVKRNTKRAVRTIKNTIHRITLAIKGVGALIAMGGGTAVAVIVIIMLLALVVCSPYGIFCSGENIAGSTQTMAEVVEEINGEYTGELERIKSENTYDVLEMSGAKATWQEVLSVYAILINTNPENPQEVVTMDENKKEQLSTIFWEMNVISFRTEEKTETIVEVSEDEKGGMVEEKKEVTRVYLYIAIAHRSAEEMADKYGFTEEQKVQLSELLAERNADIWTAVLYGVTSGNGNDDIVSVAKSQLGNEGGEPYWSWYGFGSRVSWCACFVSWCAEQCGYIEMGVIPKFASCANQGVPWFQERGQWQDGGYIPAPGDLIFFDWDGDESADHVGIVEKAEYGMVHTIEGNTGDACKQHTYPVESEDILGYGVVEH